MRWRRKKRKEERYAVLLGRWETHVDARLRRLSDYLRVKTDTYSQRVKWIGLIVFVIAISVVCGIIIYNVFK
jgi:hypothetical protein